MTDRDRVLHHAPKLGTNGSDWCANTSSHDVFLDFDFGESAAPASANVPTPADRQVPPQSPAFGSDPCWPPSIPPENSSDRVRFPQVPGYEILDELGRGGMGVVYKARERRLNRFVALKMILAGDHAGLYALERLRTEAETIARLQHPNIVQIYAIGECDGLPFVVLEFVEGGTLSERVDGRPWPFQTAAQLVECVSRAVSHAHQLGIVHRDLKPANILLTLDGEPKVSDFGLAKTAEHDSGLTRTQSILGSPSYMAPEQAGGHAKDVGPAADVYALGANLYELLTGRPPFVAPSVLTTLEMVKNAEPVSPRRLQPSLPRDLETICLKCLEKNPRERYESAEALADDLLAFLEGEAIRARPTSSCERAVRWVRKRPSTAGLILLSLVALVGLAGSWAAYRAENSRRAQDAIQNVESLRARAGQFVRLGEESLRHADWAGARSQLSSALALIGTEARLGAMRTEVERLHAESVRKLEEQKARDAARSRLNELQRLYDEAVFYQSDYTGLNTEANVLASRRAALGALELFDLDAAPPVLKGARHEALELQTIRTTGYQLVLILAEATARAFGDEDPTRQAFEALRILETATKLQAPSPAFYLRRAALLKTLGDAEAADIERQKSEAASRSAWSAVDDFLVGQQAYRENDLRRAASSFHQVLSRQPDHFWAQYLLAVCDLKAHRAAAAQAGLLACQSRRPKFVWAYLLKGFAEAELREFDLAEADFQRAQELGLDHEAQYVMLVNRGVLRIKRTQNDAAIADLEAAVALKPNQFQAYVNLAQAYQNLNRLADATQTLDRAIARDSRQALLYRARSLVYRAWSRADQALEDLRHAIASSSPDDPLLASDYIEQGLLLHLSGRDEEALTACEQAMSRDASRLDIQSLRGVVLVALKRFDEAIPAFDRCLSKGKPTPELYEARGVAHASRGAYSKAISDYTLALSMGRNTASLLSNRAWAYLFSGASELAVNDFDAALRIEPGNSHALSGRALGCVQLRRPIEAVDDARGSLSAETTDARLVYNAARVLSQAAACLETDAARTKDAWATAGQYRTDAVGLVARALELTPKADRPRFWLEVVRNDAALDPIRRSQRFTQMDGRVVSPNDRRVSRGEAAR